MKKVGMTFIAVVSAAIVLNTTCVKAEQWTDETETAVETEDIPVYEESGNVTQKEDAADQAEKTCEEELDTISEEPDQSEDLAGDENILPEVRDETEESIAESQTEEVKPYEITMEGMEMIVDMKNGCTANDIIQVLEWQRDKKYLEPEAGEAVPCPEEFPEGGYLTVNVPAGTYKTSRTIYVYSNTTLNSDEGAKYESVFGGEKCLLGSYNFNGDVGGYEQIQNVMIDGGDFDGNDLGCELIRFIHGNNIRIENAVIHNVLNKAHHLTLAGVNNVEVTNCEFYGYAGTTEKEAIHFDVVNNSTIAPGTDNYDDTVPQNITISNCYFHDLSRGIGSHSAVKGLFMNNVRIVNNYFENIMHDAIKVFNHKDLEISGNKIDGAGRGIFVHTLLKGAEKSYYMPNSEVGSEEIPDKEHGYNYNIDIYDNDITNISSASGKGRGIELAGNPNLTLGGVTVINNTIDKPQQYGIFLNESVSYSDISQNVVRSSFGSGIVLYSCCRENRLLNNTMTYPRRYGISISGSDIMLVQGNRVEYSTYNSIQLTNSEDCTISKNRIKSSRATGISLTAGSHRPVISNNVIYNSMKNAVYVSKCNTVKILSNTIQRTKNKSGIVVVDCNASRTSYNQFTNTPQTPLQISKTKKANTVSLYLARINTVKTSSRTVTGTVGKTGSTVTVKIGSKTYAARVNNRKYTSKTIPRQKKGTLIVVSEKDKKGNIQTVTRKVS